MDITQERATVVCRFAGANYTDGPVELIKGDRLQELKDVSMSNLDPRTWFK
jgi:hypothetical protein